MDESSKEVKKLFESLQSTMLQLLDLDPGNGWFWVAEAQRRVMRAQMSTVEGGKKQRIAS